MAITKILAKNSRLDVLIRYVTNQDMSISTFGRATFCGCTK